MAGMHLDLCIHASLPHGILPAHSASSIYLYVKGLRIQVQLLTEQFSAWKYCTDTGSAIDIPECGSNVLQIKVRVAHTAITVLSRLHLAQEIVLEWVTCT